MKFYSKTLLAALCVALIAGCSSTPTKKTDTMGAATVEDRTAVGAAGNGKTGMPKAMSADETPGPGGIPAPVMIASADTGMDGMGGAAGTSAIAGMPAKRVVYFDFDKSDLRDDAQPVIVANAEFLASRSNVKVTLEGHCDERGTAEYNMALGEHRAKSVFDVMRLKGVSATQVSLVSYGKERPAVDGHDEAAWQYNRRVELNYSSAK